MPPDPDPAPDNHIRDVLAIGGFLLAVTAATLVLRHRRKRPADPSRAPRHDPHPPQVRVHVVEDVRPSIHIRQVIRAPAVRVRLSGGEPRLEIREVPR
ncbi:hypothetical protein [Nocardia nepalensis]|uniref:hypothetical protein n=1 Tax=Nocardia nepalensis TaxID=3375448 RepID=UPI003B67FEC3